MRAYAVAGSFDDCHRLTRDAFADPDLRRSVRLTSANSINIGRLLPQMVYYFHAVAQLGRAGQAGQVGEVVFSHAERQLRQPHRRPDGEARRAADRALRRRDQRQRRRAGVPRDRPVRAARRRSQTIANAMDVGHPSNFERMLWLYGSDVDAMRARRHRQPLQRRRGAGDDQAGLRGARLPARSAQRDCVPGAHGRGRRDGRQDRRLSRRPRIRRSSRRSSSRSSAGRSRSRRRWPRRSRAAAHHPDSRLARSRCSACSMAERVPLSRRRARAAAGARRPADGADRSRAGARLRPRSLQVRDPPAARALPAQASSRRSSTPDRVDELRRRYPVLALQPRDFIEP